MELPRIGNVEKQRSFGYIIYGYFFVRTTNLNYIAL